MHISLYLDHPKVGCGWRPYIVLKSGRLWASLLATETAERIKIPVGLLKTGRPLPVKRTRMARRLREVARTYGEQDSVAVKDALAVLRQKGGAA